MIKKLRLGTYYPGKIYVQKLRIGSPIYEMQTGNPPQLYRAFLEINNLCNRNCRLCGFYGIKNSKRCLSYNKWARNDEPLATGMWRKLSEDLKDLGCIDLFVTAGDLTLTWDETKNIVDHAHGKFDSIYITIPQRNLFENIGGYLRNKAKLIVQLGNSDKNSLERQINYLVIQPESWRTVDKAINENITEGFNIIHSEIILNRPAAGPKKRADLNFLNDRIFHSCLNHTIAVTYTGDVLPCPIMRDHKFGNVKEEELWAILSKQWKKIYNIWTLNLDKIEPCSYFGFRYSCADCRALEETLTGRLNGKTPCNYDPVKGHWK
jgi:radical SAM protein with 4Fe4S-binding SPASM domain